MGIAGHDRENHGIQDEPEGITGKREMALSGLLEPEAVEQKKSRACKTLRVLRSEALSLFYLSILLKRLNLRCSDAN